MLIETAADAAAPAPGPTLRRWTRHGQDRLYVRTAAGVTIGYRDNRTGVVVPTDAEHRDVLLAALGGDATSSAHGPAGRPPAATDERSGSPAPTLSVPSAAPVPAAPLAPAQEPVPAATSMGCTDLAATVPGAAARARAVELRQAAPVRTFLSRALGLKTEERAWRIGADGEAAVAKELRALGGRWKVLHAVPVGTKGADIDHVVIGPGGIFTVNTKHHPHADVWVGGETVLVNGTRVPYVRNSRYEAARAGRLLATAAGGQPESVTGVVAVMRCAKFTVKSAPESDVVVTTRRRLVRWLEQRPEVLTDDRVAALFDLARREDTWRSR